MCRNRTRCATTSLAGWCQPRHKPTPVDTDMEEKRNALAHHQSLQRNLSSLLVSLRSGNIGALESRLLAAQADAHGIGNALTVIVNTTLYTEVREEDSKAAQQVFAIPEIFTMILGYLEIPDIMKVYQVNRSSRDIIEGSSMIQRQLSLRPAPSHHNLSTPLDSCLSQKGGFHCFADVTSASNMARIPPMMNEQTPTDSRGGFGSFGSSTSNASEQTPKYNARIRAGFLPTDGKRLFKIGSRYRNMFICQPPIKAMRAFLSCCPGHRASFRSPEDLQTLIESESGITIGDLYDQTTKLIEIHRLCPNARWWSHDDEGNVTVDVHFIGDVQLSDNDPLLLSHRQKALTNLIQQQDRASFDTKIRAYAAAKGFAYDHEGTIPTLKQFLDSVPDHALNPSFWNPANSPPNLSVVAPRCFWEEGLGVAGHERLQDLPELCQ